MIMRPLNYTTFLITTLIYFGSTENSKDLRIIGEPNNFFVLNDTTLIVYDDQNKDREVCLINTEIPFEENEKNCIRKGRGPGEISGLAMRFYIDREQNQIYIWDGGNKNLNLYSYELDYIKTIPHPGFDEVRGARFRVPLGNGDEFISTFKVGLFGYYFSAQDNQITPIPVQSDLVEPAKTNPLLLQGDYAVDWESNSMIFVTEFSSLVLKIKDAKVNFLTLGDPNLPFPENEKESGFALPRMSTYTFASIDVSIDNNIVYILHSGERPSRRKTIWYELRDRLDEYADQLLESKKVLVYNMENGNFHRNIELDQKAIKSKVYNGKIYYLIRGRQDTRLRVSSLQNF